MGLVVSISELRNTRITYCYQGYRYWRAGVEGRTTWTPRGHSVRSTDRTLCPRTGYSV